MKAKIAFLSLGLAALACFFVSNLALADSQVRIVRLSQVEGAVKIDRNTGSGFERAFLNLPITQGTKIQTQADGRVEVEFEDGSTLRMAPQTLVEFPELALRDDGRKVSLIKLQEGTGYLDYVGAKSSDITLSFGHESIQFTKAAHVRVQMRDTDATLAVFKGEVKAAGPAGTVEVSSKHSANFNLAEGDQFALAKDITPMEFDPWDKQQGQYQKNYDARSSYAPYAYGVSDLNYYGSFFDYPGYGFLWRPYFASAAWDPFTNGGWYWYPGFGYTWVSGYPWGWMPYRYGAWTFVPGFGWAWQAGTGSVWSGWSPIPRVVNAPKQFVMPRPPATPGQTVLVNRGPVNEAMGNGNKLTIRNDSAGMGIPRGKVSDLGRASFQAQKSGIVTPSVHSNVVRPSAPVFTPSPGMRGGFQPHGMGASGGVRTGGSPMHAGGGSRPSAPPPSSAPHR
jgi:FecR protein